MTNCPHTGTHCILECWKGTVCLNQYYSRPLTCISCAGHGEHRIWCSCKDAPTHSNQPLFTPELKDYEVLEQRVKETEAKYDLMVSEYNLLCETNRMLKEDVSDRQVLLDACKAENKKQDIEIFDLSQENEKLGGDNKRLKEAHEYVLNHKNQFVKMCNESDIKIIELKDELERLRRENGIWLSEIGRLKTEKEDWFEMGYEYGQYCTNRFNQNKLSPAKWRERKLKELGKD